MKWSQFVKETQIENLRIPRCLSIATASSNQLHGFSDESESRYAAHIFLCTEDAKGDVSI